MFKVFTENLRLNRKQKQLELQKTLRKEEDKFIRESHFCNKF